MRRIWLISAAFLLGWTGLIQAATPPERVNGTILGKALESLDAGTGLIKVLVMLR